MGFRGVVRATVDVDIMIQPTADTVERTYPRGVFRLRSLEEAEQLNARHRPRD